MLYLDKERDDVVVNLHEEVVENMKGVALDKLTIIKLDYSYRVRYEKDGDGNVVAKVMDRGFIGLLGSKIGLASLDSDSVYTCFIYGKRTIGSVIKDGELLCNNNLINSSDFQVLMANLSKEKGLSIVWIEGLPTGEVVKKAPKTLDDLLANVKTLDDLSSDLGF